MAVFCLLILCSCGKETFRLYVDPNIGTIHSRWFFYTPAAVPFGMAKLGASTNGTYGNVQGWEAVGYDDRHTSIDGFPCFHEFQIGGISLMPVTGDLITTPGTLENPDSGFRSRFDKKDELAEPGYYSVLLKDYNVKAELTATERVGFQRFTFPSSDKSIILFNIGNREGESGEAIDAKIALHNGDHIDGYVETVPEYVKKYQAGASVKMYFSAELDKTPDSAKVFTYGEIPVSAQEIKRPGAVMALYFHTAADEKITVKLGLSYTSIENASLNLKTEAGNLSFDKAKIQAFKKWENALARIKVYGDNVENKKKFYTGLYHALLGRGLASDVNGAYPKNDGSIGQIPLDSKGQPKFNCYNTDAIWGAYWNLTTLWALAYPEYYNEYINSHLMVYKDAGWLGDGIAAGKYVSGVGTNMLSIAIAGAYNSGIRNYDIDEAYSAIRKNELEWEGRPEGAGKMDVKMFVDKGYVPYDNSVNFGVSSLGATFSASHTLEYSFSAYAAAQMAKSLGHSSDYEKLMKLSDGWENLFDDSLKLIRPKLPNGQFIDNFNPLESWRGFQEGNAQQYTYFVPQNPEKLVSKIGSKKFNETLDSIFTVARKSVFGGGKEVYAFSGIQSPYNHGNQPSLHIPWLFNFSGAPYLTQKWVRIICDEFYGTDPEHGYGYGQDEDQGQLGAWYVISSMGLFDVKGGSDIRPTFQIGSPLFDKIKISGNAQYGHKPFVINVSKQDPESCYIQSISLNGKELDRIWLYRDEVFDGGELDIELGAAPIGQE